MRGVIYSLIAIIFVSLQTTLLEYISIFGVKPNILLAFLISVSLFCGPVEGGMIGLLCGLIFDVLGYGIFGFHSIFYLYAGVLVGYFAMKYFRDSLLFHVILSFCVCFVIEASYILFMFIIWGKGGLSSVVFLKILFESIYTATFAVPIYYLVRVVSKKGR